MNSPKVSVVVPIFNRAGFISESLDSLQRERKVETEIIVVDDGSTDGSVDAVRVLAKHDPRIRLITGEHRGVSATRNIGVHSAIGKYITFLDSDDISAPGRICRQLHKLESNPGIAAVIGETLWFEALTRELDPVPGTRYVRTLAVTLHSAMFCRSTFDAYGLFDEALELCEDLDFFLRLLEGGAKFLLETEIASLCRRHQNNLTSNGQAVRKAFLAALQRSIARRRGSGHKEPLDVFFLRRFAVETFFNSRDGAVQPSSEFRLDELYATKA
jgi:glycosyltransferase involved in cell wall biosynthesis